MKQTIVETDNYPSLLIFCILTASEIIFSLSTKKPHLGGNTLPSRSRIFAADFRGCIFFF